MEKRTGTVKKIVSERGFGFIKDQEKDYFFHFSNMVDPEKFKQLEVGDKVEFNISQDKANRDIAINIKGADI